ncbi:hypothetical protein MLGJGCBP_03750 [Rhodococcus sp. T7]|nr:hypothetical protein MLGJGCBP_03750 [Rhodococcus sp. T7]
MGAVGDDAVVGADLHGEFDGRGVAVEHDHGDTGDGLQDLDADVAESARSDHDAHVSGPGGLRGLGDGVVRRQARVGEGGDVGRFERVVDPDHAAGGGAKVFGVPAVDVDAGEPAVLAVDVVAESARPAQPARDERVQDDLVADRDIGDGVAHGVDPAGVLVADRVRQSDTGLLLPLPFENMQVGAAHAGAADPHDDIEGALDRGFGNVGELQFGVVSHHLHGLHRGLLGVLRLVIRGVAPTDSLSA